MTSCEKLKKSPITLVSIKSRRLVQAVKELEVTAEVTTS